MQTVSFAVNGTLMRGLELNENLLNAGATFIKETFTEPAYRLWSIEDRHPAMMKVKTGGTSISVELWAIPTNNLAQILLQEPPGLCIGQIRLLDEEEVLGVLGEAFLCEGKREITQWGGWRAYIADFQEKKLQF